MTRLVLFFTEGVSLKTWYEAGVLERDTLLYAYLAQRGYEIYFLTYGDHQDAQYLPPDSPFKVLSRPEGMNKADYQRNLLKIHHDTLQKMDVIKSHQNNGSRYAALASWRLKKPYIARCGYLESYFLAQKNAPLKRRLFNWGEEFFAFHQANVICVPSQSEIDYIYHRYRINRQKARACPNWIDTDFFKPDPTIEKKPRQICFIARFEPQKDPLTLIEAVRGLENIELVMIGGGSLKSQIEAKIDEYSINARILNRLPNEELPHYLNESAVYILPTLYEGGSPKTLFEAMACGLPVVSTNAFGVDEAFIDGVHGYKCNTGDIAGFRKALQKILDNPDHARQLGQQGRQHVIDHYAIDRALERELDILKSLA